MKLLFCTTAFAHAWTGAGRFAQTVGCLQEVDPDIEVIVLSEDIEHNPEKGHYRVHWPAEQRPGYDDKSQLYARAVKDFLKEQTVDVIFFNNAWLGHDHLKDQQQIPVIAAVRDDNAIYPFGNAPGAIPGMLIRQRLERSAIRRLDHLITNSGYLAAQLQRKYHVPGDALTIIPPVYADYSGMRSEIQFIIDDPVKVLFAKNDYKRGGLGLVIKALHELPAHRFELTVAGADPATVRRKFKRQIRKSRNINFILRGRILSRPEMASIMSANHIFCVPARREAFGVANIEALSCGMRVVYHEVGGVPPELRQYAFPVANRTWKAVRDTVQTAMAADETELRSRVREGQAWAAASFRPETMYRQVVRVLRAAGQST